MHTPLESARPATSSLIKIVSSLTRSGSSRGQSDSCVNAIRMALEDVGYRVGDAVIAYEDWDGGSQELGAWDPVAEARNARYAVNDPAVLAYIAPLDADAAPVSMPITNEAGLLQVSPCATYPGLTKPVPGRPEEPDVYVPTGTRNFVRLAMADDLQGQAGAEWLAELGEAPVYVLHDAEPYGRGVAEAFAEACKRLGIDIAGGPHPLRPAPGLADYADQAREVAASGARVLYYGGRIQNGPGQLWRDLAQIAPEIVRMSADGCFEEAFLELAGPAAGGTLITFGGVPPAELTTKAGADFYAAYKDRFGIEPEPYAASTYDTVGLVLHALAEGGGHRRAVRDAAFSGRGFDGVLGHWRIEPTGDVSLRTSSRLTVSDGHFEFLGTHEVG